MHEGQVREVHQVFDDELVAALDRVHRAFPAPVAVVEERQVRNLRGVGARRLGHPHPQAVVALDDRVAFHARIVGNLRLRWDLHALAARVVLKPVIAALDRVLDHRAERQRVVAMAATVFKRGEVALHVAEENDGLVADHAGKNPAGFEVLGPTGHVPAIAQKCHVRLLRKFRKRCGYVKPDSHCGKPLLDVQWAVCHASFT